MKKFNELTMKEVLIIIWGNPNETFTRILSLALIVALVFFILGSGWLFSLMCILVCLINWFWRFYTLEVKLNGKV